MTIDGIYLNVIIGEEGVRLGKENANLAKKSRQKTGKITAIGETIKAHIPEGTTLDDFLALPDDPQIDNLIAEQKQLVEAVRQEQQIRNHSYLYPRSESLIFPKVLMLYLLALLTTLRRMLRRFSPSILLFTAWRRMEATGLLRV